MAISNAPVQLTLDLTGLDYLELKASCKSRAWAGIWGEGVLTLLDGSTTNLADLKPVDFVVEKDRLAITPKPGGRKLLIGNCF